MNTLHLILIVATLLCFGLAAVGIPSRVNLTALGLLLLTIVLLLL